MPRWVWFAPFALLSVALGLWGFRLGWISATISETDVIETYASYYVENHGRGARLTDCTAQPGRTDAVWLIVTCISPSGARFEYPANRLGRLVPLPSDPARVATPET